MKCHLLSFLLFLLLPSSWLLLLPSSAFSGTAGILEGLVKDKRTGEPLPGVNVVILSVQRGVSTDAKGSYEIQNIPAGRYDVRFALVGFRTHLAKNVIINADLRTRLNIELEASDVTLGEVIVVEEKPLIQKDVTSTAYIVSGEDVRLLPVNYATDVVGLKAGTTLEGNVRGGRATEVSYFVDGLSVQDVMGGGLSVNLPTSSVVSLSLYTGGFEPEYGNALSGVVNIVTKTGSNDHRFFIRGDKDNLFGGQQVSKTNEFEVSATGPVQENRFFYTAALNGIFSETRWWQDFQYFSFNGPIEQELNGFGKLEYLFTPTLRLNAEVLYSGHDWHDYDFSWRFNLEGLPPEHRTSYRTAVILSHSISENFFYNASLSRFSVNSKIGDGGKEDVPVNDPYQYDFSLRYIVSGQRALWVRSTQLTYTAKFDGTLKAGSDHLLKFGAEMNFYDLNSDIVKYEPRKTYFGKPLLGEPQLDFSSTYSYRPRSGAFYVQDKVDLLKEGVLLNFGLRSDFLDPRASRPAIEPVLQGDTAYIFQAKPSIPAKFKYQISPRFGMAQKVGENCYVFFNLGFYFQNPLFDYLYTGLDRVALAKGISALTGNPDLEPERSTQWEVSLKYSFPIDIVASLAYFQKETTNLIDTKTFIPGDSKLAGNYGFAEFVNIPEARASGYELVITRDRGEWLTGELSYTYMTTEGSSGSPYDGFYVAQFGLPPGRRTYPLSWDQRHTVKSTLTFKVHDDFDMNLVIHWHSGRPYTEYSTATGFEPVHGGTFIQNNARMPAYSNIDLKIEKHFKFDWWPNSVLTVYLDVRNLTNQANVSWMDSNGRVGGELGDPSGHFTGRRARYGLQITF